MNRWMDKQMNRQMDKQTNEWIEDNDVSWVAIVTENIKVIQIVSLTYE